MADTTVTIDLQQDLTNGIAAKLIRRKAKRLIGHQRLTKADQPDIEQELRIAVFKAFPKFDPDIADWWAFASTVIERKADKLLQWRKAKKRKSECHPVSLSKLVEDPDGELVPLGTQIAPEHREALTGRYCADDFDLINLRIDLETIVADLTPEQQDLCERLTRQSLPEILKELQIPRRTLRDRISVIRERFLEAGLDHFFENSTAISGVNWEV